MRRVIPYITLLLCNLILVAQEKKELESIRSTKNLQSKDIPFRETYSVVTRGNLTFIANNILNRSPSHLSYNDNSGNTNLSLDYIDIDKDTTTFSSSSATLKLPTCSKVLYAGLYWAGIYPYKHWNDEFFGINTADDDFNEIKFKVPGGNYINLKADKNDSDELVYNDGPDDLRPYICHKDVTSLIAGLSNPNGEYFAANIKATLGQDIADVRSGSSAGWNLVIVYANENESIKKFYVFDGFATISRKLNPRVDVKISGFHTVPSGPVKASILVAALEGDKSISGDSFQILNPFSSYSTLTSGNNNPKNNFFNSSITAFNSDQSNRNPDSKNTLGYDIDLFTLNNPNNSILKNDQESATFRFTTSGDSYFPFLLGMAVEAIEPKIELVKTVQDGSGKNIGGKTVALGSELWYNISFQNTGTDNAKNTKITDILPKNVKLIETEIEVPNGMTSKNYTYTPPSSINKFKGVLKISIPDSMVKEGGAKYNIRFKVKVISSCNDLTDACSNIIKNQAFASYKGVIGNDVFDNDPSINSSDTCNFGIDEATSFSVDVSDCSYEREEVLCGSILTLSAGDGFTSYEWKDSSNNTIGKSQTLTVSKVGTYTVNKIAPSGCVGGTEKINVIPHNNDPNPLISFVDKKLICPSDGSELAEIYLCAYGDSRKINLPFKPASKTTVIWEKLDESSCTSQTTTSCANLNTSCVWNKIGTNLSMEFTEKGQYRVEVLYDGRCPKFYYFNIFKASLNLSITKEDIICGKKGKIILNGVPSGYKCSLSGPNGYHVDYQDSSSFIVSDPGDYYLKTKVEDPSVASCIYQLSPVNIKKESIELNIKSKDILCTGDTGEIRVQVNVPGPYNYTFFKDGANIGSEGPTSKNDLKFLVSSGGTYKVKVTTNKCSITEDVTLKDASGLKLTAALTKNISCLNASSDGVIKLTGSGGTLNKGDQYSFAVWTEQGTDLYTSVSDIPATKFFTDDTFTVANKDQGKYRFVVIDSNNCSSISNPIDIKVEPPLQFTSTIKDISCNGKADGRISVSVKGNRHNYLVEYNIDNGSGLSAWNKTGNFSNLNKGSYKVNIRASKNNYQCMYLVEAKIKEPDAVSSSAILSQDYTCNTLGQITFSKATGGTPPYTYGINGIYNSNLKYKDLTEGNYVLTVKDNNGCTSSLDSLVISAVPVIPAFTTDISYSCDGVGKVTLIPPSSSTLTFTYKIKGNTSLNPTGNIFNNLKAGKHTITVMSPRACDRDFVVSVSSDQEFRGAILSSEDNFCHQGGSGKVLISATNYDGGEYEYSVDGGKKWHKLTKDSDKITGLESGTYTVLLKDQGCKINLGNVTISDVDQLKVKASITKEITCSSTNGGAVVKAEGSGGIPPYKFSLDGTNWQDSPTFGNLSAGVTSTDYKIYIKDSRNCDECVYVAPPTSTVEECSFSKIDNETKMEDLFDVIHGKATIDDQFTATLTKTRAQTSMIVAKERISLAKNFKFSFEAYLGTNEKGRGGLALIFHNDPRGISAVGNCYYQPSKKSGFENAILFEIDTRYQVNPYVKAEDRINIYGIPNNKTTHSLSRKKINANLEDGKWHKIDLLWEVKETDTGTNYLMYVHVDGVHITGFSGSDIIKRYLKDDEVYFGFTSFTGGPGNLQRIRFNDFCSNIPYCPRRCEPDCIPTDTTTITVEAPSEIAYTVTSTNCYDGSNGEIKVNVTKGNGDYQFILNNGSPQIPNPTSATTYTFKSLGPGTYTIDVIDGRECKGKQQSITINDQLSASAITKNASCSDGAINISAVGGDGNYLYSLVAANASVPVDSLFKKTNIINKKSGTYDAYVRDKNGAKGYCQFLIEDLVIKEVTEVTISTKIKQPVCNGDSGSISLTISEGEFPHDILVTNSAGTTVKKITDHSGSSFNLNDLPSKSGTSNKFEEYKIKITDALGCSDSKTVKIYNPPALTTTIVPEKPSCGTEFVGNEKLFGIDFTAYPTIKAPYKIQFSVDNGSTWQDSPKFRGSSGNKKFGLGSVSLPAIRLTDLATSTITYCLNLLGSYTMPFEITPLEIKITTNPLNCSEGATAKVNVSGGIGPYEYACSIIPAPTASTNWEPSGGTTKNTHSFSKLTPGRSYFFFVRDIGDDGCIRLEGNYKTDIDVKITPTVLKESCDGKTGGTLKFTIDDTKSNLLKGGSSAINWELFSIDLSSGATSSVEKGTQGSLKPIVPKSSLGGGVYYLVINNGTSATSCEFASQNIEIQKGTPINGKLNVVNNITCDVDGVVRIDNVTGGFGDYTYDVKVYEKGNSSNKIASYKLPANSHIISVDDTSLGGVSSVDVKVTVTDANGCTGDLAPVTLTFSAAPVLEAGDISTKTCNSNKSITITGGNGAALGGTAPYQYSKDGGVTFSASTKATSYTFNSLKAGSYDIVVRDSNGCTSSQNGITIYPELDFTLTVKQNLNCKPGEAIIGITINSGGNLGTKGNFSYTITAVSSSAITPSKNTGVISGTSVSGTHKVTKEGIYEIKMTDNSSGCVTTQRETINPIISPNFSLTASIDSICSGSKRGQIQIKEINNGINPLSYSIKTVSGGPYSGSLDKKTLEWLLDAQI